MNFKNKLSSVAHFAVIFAIIADLTVPKTTSAETNFLQPTDLLQGNAILSIEETFNPGTLPKTEYIKARKTIKVVVTAYSSTPDQTDDTPFITASGSTVHYGTLAANFLPFGTKVRFPDYDKDKIYVVEDRMHPRFSKRADIWMETRGDAKQFGIKTLTMEIF
jgi:3D (Asp-Asp-Asp) domain-containing protein